MQRLVICLVIYGLIRLIFWGNAFPNPDEAYYWLWGQHLDWSYYDHPPLMVWLQRGLSDLLEQILGTGFTATHTNLRTLNLISNGLFFWTYWRILQRLYPKWSKPQIQRGMVYLVLCVCGAPLYWLMLSLAWHDHVMITLALMGATEFWFFTLEWLENQRGSTIRLYLAGILLGLACLAKYNGIFMTLGLCTAVITTRQLRPLLKDYRFWVAGILLILMLYSIVHWNLSNNLLSFQFYATRSVDMGMPLQRLLEPIGFLVISLLMLSPINSFFFWQIGKQIKYRSFWQRSASQTSVNSSVNSGDNQRILEPQQVYQTFALWTFAIPTITLSLISMVSTALYYWNITAYLLLFPLIPQYLIPQDLDASSAIGQKQNIFWTGQGLGLLFAILFCINSVVLPISALWGRDGDLDNRMLYGWAEMIPIIKAERQALQTEGKINTNLPILTTDYRSAAALAYSLAIYDSANYRSKISNSSVPDVTAAISTRISQFSVWDYRRKFTNSPLDHGNALIVYDDWHPLKEVKMESFQNVAIRREVLIKRFGIPIKTYTIAWGENWLGKIQNQRKGVSSN